MPLSALSHKYAPNNNFTFTFRNQCNYTIHLNIQYTIYIIAVYTYIDLFIYIKINIFDIFKYIYRAASVGVRFIGSFVLSFLSWFCGRLLKIHNPPFRFCLHLYPE